MKFETQVVHNGQHPDLETGALMPAIYMTSTFAQEAPGVHKGYDYTRAGNPNFTKLEALLAPLEGAKYCTVFSSGLGATTAVLNSLESGDHVLAIQGLYGGTFRLFTRCYKKWGLHFHFVSPVEVEEFLKKYPIKMLFFETPTNPLLGIVDIHHMCQLARKAGALSVVDNTFATPYFQNPLLLGADAVIHSTTKYIGGHSDVIGGALMTSLDSLHEAVLFARMAIGLNPSPFDAWLTTRGVKTLAVRMERHENNAKQLAEYFQQHRIVKKVHYPGLKTHPGHAIAKGQMRGFSGMVSVEFDLSLEATKKVISSLKVFTLAESLGGVESLVCHPVTMTHASIPVEERLRIGLTDGLIRFSVGIENVEDLVEDIESSLRRV